ncbi:MAG: glycosyltransferase family 39 protein [Microthrixaceae bacterium]
MTWLIVVGVLVRLVVIFTPITYELDAWRQADTASIARNFARHGMNPWLPQINWGGAGKGYVESEFQLLPYVTAVLYRIFGEHVWFGRAISLACSTATMLAFRDLTRRMLRPRVALLALAVFVAAPIFVRYSVAFMPEATMFLGYVGAIALFGRWLDSGAPRLLYGAGAAFTLAVLVKPTAIHLALVLFIWALVTRRDRLRSWRVVVVGVASLAPVAAWYVHGHRLYERYGNTFGVISGGDSKWGASEPWCRRTSTWAWPDRNCSGSHSASLPSSSWGSWCRGGVVNPSWHYCSAGSRPWPCTTWSSRATHRGTSGPSTTSTPRCIPRSPVPWGSRPPGRSCGDATSCVASYSSER